MAPPLNFYIMEVSRRLPLYLGILLLGSALMYEVYRSTAENHSIHHISSSWKRLLYDKPKGVSTVLVGINANLDMIVSAVELLRILNATGLKPYDYSFLSSVAHLDQVVGYSMGHCIGLERTFANYTLFDLITNTAASLSHVYHVGGNAALMAEKIKATNPAMQVILVGAIGRKLRRLLRDDIQTPGYDSNGREEIHMILEYASKDVWGGVESFCANRVIFSNDTSNSRMVALEQVQEAVTTYAPDLVVLSGAHLLEGQDHAFWKKRLHDIRFALEEIVVPVHWELATVGNLDFFYHLAQTIFSRVESLGLNEQELMSAAKSSDAPFNFGDIPSKPGVEWASDLLHWLMLTFSSVKWKSSSLTRIHLHSLSFHVIATVEGGPWTNSKEAVVAGAQAAGLQACGRDDFHSKFFELRFPKQFHISATDELLSGPLQTVAGGWSKWSRDGIEYHLSPVLVCKAPTKTVGLGDAISSLGLIRSVYTR